MILNLLNFKIQCHIIRVKTRTPTETKGNIRKELLKKLSTKFQRHFSGIFQPPNHQQNKKPRIEDENSMAVDSLSNFLEGQTICKSDENFLKEFSRNFYRKIIDIKDFNKFETILSDWIRNLGKNIETIFELMKNHEQNRFWFSSIIGFFYQFGVGCDVDDGKALEFYLLAVNNDEKEYLNHNFTHLHLNDDKSNTFQNI